MMQLLLPLGLLALLGIVALILIYILKPKYQERKISSSFIWKLSLSYKKKRLPLEWLTTSLLFFVQILAITLIAFMLAQPLIAFPTTSGDKIAIIDGSASMSVKSDGKTRFSRAVEKIVELTEKQTESDRFTLIFAGETATLVIERTDDMQEIRTALETLTWSLFESDVEGAMLLANQVLRYNTNAEVYLFTDHEYSQHGFVNVVNVAYAAEWNVAILSSESKYIRGRHVFYTTVASYGRDSIISVSLSIDLDGKSDNTYETVLSRTALSLKDGIPREIIWENPVLSFSCAKVEIIDFGLGNNASDYFSYDNTYEIYGGERSALRIQVVSDYPKFINSAISASAENYSQRTTYADLSDTDPELIEFLRPHTTGYNMYIYDSILPREFPTDGSIWLINPQESGANLMPFAAELECESKNLVTFVDKPQKFVPANNGSELANAILKGINLNSLLSPITVTAYTKFKNYDNCNIIVTAEDGTPLIFTKKINNADLIVFAFPFAYSTVEMSYIWPRLASNICGALVKHPTDKLVYTLGDVLNVKPQPNATNVKIEHESEVLYLKDNSEPANIVLNELGTYSITQVVDNNEKVGKIFVQISTKISNFSEDRGFLAGEQYSNPDTGQISEEPINSKKSIDLIKYIAYGLLVLLLIEWGLQYREL